MSLQMATKEQMKALDALEEKLNEFGLTALEVGAYLQDIQLSSPLTFEDADRKIERLQRIIKLEIRQVLEEGSKK